MTEEEKRKEGRHRDSSGKIIGETDKYGRHWDSSGKIIGETDSRDKESAGFFSVLCSEKKSEKSGGSGSSSSGSSGGCFISTACAKTEGLSDDCVELETLRDFRDNYVRNLPNGEEILKEYYKIAPSIVTEIDRKENSKKIYQSIKQDLIDTALILIKLGKKEEAFTTYCSVVKKLKQEYNI